MFEFQKLCHEVEELNPSERAVLLGIKSIDVVKGLKALDMPDMDPIGALATFIMGSAVADGVICEKDYLYIYPSLSRALGGERDLAEIKSYYKVPKDAQKMLKEVTEKMIAILSKADETLGNDIISLCLLVTSVDGKVNLKEKRYIKQLCRA